MSFRLSSWHLAKVDQLECCCRCCWAMDTHAHTQSASQTQLVVRLWTTVARAEALLAEHEQFFGSAVSVRQPNRQMCDCSFVPSSMVILIACYGLLFCVVCACGRTHMRVCSRSRSKSSCLLSVGFFFWANMTLTAIAGFVC